MTQDESLLNDKLLTRKNICTEIADNEFLGRRFALNKSVCGFILWGSTTHVDSFVANLYNLSQLRALSAATRRSTIVVGSSWW